MKLSVKVMLAVSVATLASTAHAGELSIKGLAQTRMTYTSTAAINAAKTSAYSGVGSLFVSYASTATTGFGSVCTGSLVNSRTVVTAAHCVYDYDEDGNYDPVTGVQFILPSFGDALAGTPGTEIIDASNWAFNPLVDSIDADGSWTGTVGAHYLDIGSGYDVAMLTLSELANGYDTYDFYTGDPLQQFIEVGAGTSGNQTGTNGGQASDYLKRTGTNIFEFYGDDIFTDVSHGVVLADFDDGTAAHDVFGRFMDASQRGIAGESNSSPGDSGGPELIDGKIVSVTSFGITGGIFQGFCGGNGSVDPYRLNNQGNIVSSATTNLSLCTNSSVGEIAGNTLVSYNMDFINAYMAANPVPEPAVWLQMIAGFGALGFAMRSSRRVRRSVAFA